VIRYNKLLKKINSSLKEILKALKGVPASLLHLHPLLTPHPFATRLFPSSAYAVLLTHHLPIIDNHPQARVCACSAGLVVMLHLARSLPPLSLSPFTNLRTRTRTPTPAGLVVMSDALDALGTSLFNNSVPTAWAAVGLILVSLSASACVCATV
jgi:hypothetical protein